MKKTLTIIGLALASAAGAQAQILINDLNTPYTTFTGTTFAGSSASLPTGWTVKVNDFDPGGTYAGTSGTGSVYNWSYNSNNHIGIQRSSTTTWGFDVSFENNTGNVITELSINLDYSQIRYVNETAFLVTGTGALNSADLTGLNFTGSSTGTNGTVTGISDSLTITGLNIADGAVFGISWEVSNPSGADSAIGMGNFSLNAVPEPGTLTLIGIGSAFALWNVRRRRQVTA